MNPRHLRMRKLRAKITIEQATKLVLARHTFLLEPWPVPDDPRALTLLRANSAVERSMKVDGRKW